MKRVEYVVSRKIFGLLIKNDFRCEVEFLTVGYTAVYGDYSVVLVVLNVSLIAASENSEDVLYMLVNKCIPDNCCAVGVYCGDDRIESRCEGGVLSSFFLVVSDSTGSSVPLQVPAAF